jgi:hypothetical protein
LFGKNSYITYKNNFKDLICNAKNILNDKNKQRELNMLGPNIIKSRHTHKIRANEFVESLYDEMNTIDTVETKEKITVVYFIGNPTEEMYSRLKLSYNSLLTNKADYDVVISEVGMSSNEEKLKTIIPNANYCYFKNDIFDGSIAKNNAFKYLIKTNLFVFLDLDMLVPDNFIESSIDYYNKTNKPFVYEYKRCKPNTNTSNYKIAYETNRDVEIRKNGDLLQGGLILCDKYNYIRLNGFDETYKGWGSRDSDFNMRLKLWNSITKFSKIILLHQYHDRAFGKNKANNKAYFKKRRLECQKDITQIPFINGLVDLTEYRKIAPKSDNINTPKEELYNLLKSNQDICLLKETCRDFILEKDLQFPLHVAIKDTSKQKNPTKIKLYDYPKKVKNLLFNNGPYTVQVPFPVISYLIAEFGKDFKREYNKRKK